VEAMVYCEEPPGEVKYFALTPELEAEGFSDEDVAAPGEGVPAVVLWP
jgi:hypothetical protein